MATKRQQLWQAERRARGECRQCGKPAALKKDGKPAALCDGCKARKSWGRRKAQTLALVDDVLHHDWRCPDHPAALPMPSRYNLGEWICTVYVIKTAGNRAIYDNRPTPELERSPCGRKSTDEPPRTHWDNDIIWGKGASRQAKDMRVGAGAAIWAAAYEEMGRPLPSVDPVPLETLLRKSEYFRWHYRMYQCMPWERSA